MSLKATIEIGNWLAGVEVPKRPLVHQPRILPTSRMEHAHNALREAALDVARRAVDLLAWGLDLGHWRSHEHLLPDVEIEIEECQALCH